MKQERLNERAIRRSGQGLLIMLMAFRLLAVGSPAQAGPPGDEYDANVFGTLVFAADGSAISMDGTINFHLRSAKSASGGGTYRIGVPGVCSVDMAACFEDADCVQDPDAQTCAGSDFASGDWEATKLEGFVVKGHCGDFPDCPAPPSFTAGKGTFKIDMSDLGRARFIMWCRLPGIPLPPFNAFPESYRVDIGSLHFNSQNLAGNFFELIP